MLSQQSDSIRAHMEGERSEGRGWLKQVQARWLGLAIERDLEPLCVGLCPCLERKHMHVHTYTCSVGFPLTHAEVFSMCHSGNLEQVNPAIPALHLEYHRQPCLNSRFIYLFFLAASKSGLLLFSLNSEKKKKNPLKMVFLSTAVRQYKQSLALTSSGLVYLISGLLLSLKTDARDSGCSVQQFSQDVPSI